MMWDTPFDESMLDESDVIIYCPEEYLAKELMEILERNGVEWSISGNPTCKTNWEEYRHETCYWVRSKQLSFGDRNCARRRSYADYVRCTFRGEKADFEISEADFEAIISGRG